VLAGRGLLAALSQAADLGLRHWWPLGALLGARSAALRRFLVAAALCRGVAEHRRCSSHLPLAAFLVARRLDDVAYGTGLWIGAVRARAWSALLPDVRGTWSSVAGRRDTGVPRPVGGRSRSSAAREHDVGIAEKR
jgi:hypothetical protein